MVHATSPPLLHLDIRRGNHPRVESKRLKETITWDPVGTTTTTPDEYVRVLHLSKLHHFVKEYMAEQRVFQPLGALSNSGWPGRNTTFARMREWNFVAQHVLGCGSK